EGKEPQGDAIGRSDEDALPFFACSRSIEPKLRALKKSHHQEPKLKRRKGLPDACATPSTEGEIRKWADLLIEKSRGIVAMWIGEEICSKMRDGRGGKKPCSGRKNPPFDLKLARHHARHAHGDGMKAKGFIDGGTEELRPKRRLEGWTKRLTDERSDLLLDIVKPLGRREKIEDGK